MENIRYAGFWIRVAATLIDSFIFMMIAYPIMFHLYGMDYFYGTQMVFGPTDFLMNYVLPIVLTAWLWIRFKGTPGKKLLGLIVVDFKTHEALNLKQSLIRQIGYMVMALPLFLGFVILAFDKYKRGWHDKMSGSAVIYQKSLEHQGE